MCGIAGIIGSTNIVNQSVAQTLARNLAHRGPDDQGIELLKPQQNPDTLIALVHRRLSIIDLTEAAHQPMKDPSTGNIIIYNGEVYNFKELRQELEAKGIEFHSKSDTEVVLKAYQTFGFDFLHKLCGMFAFAIWDQQKQKLLLARDRLGIKTISIVSIGEPFLDKKLASRIRAAKKLGLKVIVSTNGSLLKPQIANDIINSGLDELHISIDGHTKQTYESIRIGLNFDQVLSNVRQFMHAREASHNKHPKVMIRCVGLKQNQNELKSFQKFWHNIVDDCIVSHTHDWAGGVSKNFRGAFHSAALRRVPCRLIWKELMVHHDGAVVACCHDYEGALKVGDIKHQPLTEIWNGKQLFLLRQAHLSRNLSNLPTCAKCHVSSIWWG